MEQDEKKKRLPVWLKFSYGAAEGSNTLGWTMFYVYFLFFLTDVVGLSPSFAGLVMMIGTLWDAVTDPAVGIWSDRTKSRLGRRRSFILFTSIPYGIRRVAPLYPLGPLTPDDQVLLSSRRSSSISSSLPA